MIRVEALKFSVGEFCLGGISLELAQGEYFVLLGSPGSGKSLFLGCLCGLNRVDSGRIIIAGRDVTNLEPCERGIGYVPQDYALFPHLSVAQNIGFGLRARGLPRAEMTRKTDAVADQLGIRHLLRRSIAGLSGGEKQRVALARALVVEPQVLLLDEPVSALDEALRETICLELRRVQRETGTTTIHVCHNFEETRIVAHRTGLLRKGRLVQVGTPEDIFARPVDAEAARFLRVGNAPADEAGQNDPLARVVMDGPVDRRPQGDGAKR
jgi:ABC-type sugar transport system ATPase subunit